MYPASIPTISVIITHHNRPESLRQALWSIHNQTVKPAEIIVVDDCSTGDARQRVDALSRFTTAIVGTPRNMGPSGARNLGARIATGEWLAFLDDDDQYLSGKLETQLRYLSDHPRCVALGGGVMMRPPNAPDQQWCGSSTRRLTLSDVLYYTASMSQAMMIRRDVFLRLGGFDERLRHLEDYELGVRIVAAGLEMHSLAMPLCIYHLGGREQLSLQWGPMVRAELRVLWRYRKLCRREFGRFGLERMVARCCRERGLRRGRVLGRSVWLLGSISDVIFGVERGEFY